MRYLFIITFFAMACNKDQATTIPAVTPNLAALVAWSNSYGGSASEAHGHFLCETTEGHFLQIGETGFIPDSAKVLVVKVDSVGSLLWKTEIGQPGHNLGNSIVEVSDGYIACGAQNQDAMLTKLDKNTGAILWNKTYDLGGNDAI